MIPDGKSGIAVEDFAVFHLVNRRCRCVDNDAGCTGIGNIAAVILCLCIKDIGFILWQ